MCARSAVNSEPAAGEGNAANSWERAAGGAAIELSGPGQQVRIGSRSRRVAALGTSAAAPVVDDGGVHDALRAGCSTRRLTHGLTNQRLT